MTDRALITNTVLLVFTLIGFIGMVGYTFAQYADEGTSIHWVPPAYTHK